MKKALFYSASHAQSAHWANQLGFGPREWQHISPQSIRGYRHPTIYLVGTYWERPDWEDFLLAVGPCQPTLILAEDMVP